MRWQSMVGVLVSLWLLVGCSPHPTRTVVEEAIQWQIQHPVGIRQELVGSQQLGSHAQVLSVKVKRDQRWRGEVANQDHFQTVAGRVISGSYRLALGRQKRTLPFSVVLVPEPPSWFLAIRQGSTWELHSFAATIAQEAEAKG